MPARYGGLRPDDDDEDSLGMVVVTEELSRGSPGAAESLITRPEIMARAVLEGGIEAQKARWLPGIAAGDLLGGDFSRRTGNRLRCGFRRTPRVAC